MRSHPIRIKAPLHPNHGGCEIVVGNQALPLDNVVAFRLVARAGETTKLILELLGDIEIEGEAEVEKEIKA